MNCRFDYFTGWVVILIFASVSAVLGQNQFDVLVFTQDDPYHRENIPVGMLAFKEMSGVHQFGLTWTMDADIFTTDQMNQFEVVVFFNSNADGFTETQKKGLKQHINEGGGFVGIHVASATDGSWPWYNSLVGRIFMDHPKIQSGILEVVDPEFPATLHLPKKWMWTDEWYNFGPPESDHLKIILVVDESSYEPTRGFGDPISGMGEFHPVAWYQEYDGGRSFYSALGHHPELYEDKRYQEFIFGGIFWAATGRGE